MKSSRGSEAWPNNAATVDPATKTRSYAVSAYGVPSLRRPNVQVLTEAKTHKVILEKTAAGHRATGVQVVTKGQVQTFSATKEIILAAGVFNTPKLLELSGIGQKELLEKNDIPVKINLPGVGENLQDHHMTGVSYEVVDGVITGDPPMRQDPEALAAAQEQYEKYRAGAFTIGGIQSYTFMPTPDSTPGNLLDSHPPNPENEAYYNIVRSIVEGGRSFAGTQFLPQNFVSLGCLLSQPFSRGASHISSPNVDAMPDIDPRLLSHLADLDIMAHHVQNLEKLRKTKELAAFLKPDAHKIGELEGAKKYTRDTATTTYHCCGTAAMFPRDKGGVVDINLIVYGTENLGVVDASIFPLIPRGNILSSVYAVAEKAAHIIKSS
ncbi:hypothetical protein NM208_g5055 [Fusarium decemcellulare]|uniref:Uncharacterized protein n=1 Tax=Fusarium decemcellulare TaxID=57161 RepID=A0ACC1SID8_9HYPO|nr:hypothetical protein NM208_g5055 [Fusarium decemcellulare]